MIAEVDRQMHRLDVTDLNRWGLFDDQTRLEIKWPTYIESSSIICKASYRSDWQGGTIDFRFNNGLPDNDVDIEITPCHFGGNRKWFICPMQVSDKCHYRVRILYFDTDWFGCMECCRLTYKSKRVNLRNALYASLAALDRAEAASQTIRSLRIKRHRGKLTKKHQAASKKYQKALDSIRRTDL